MSDGGKGSAPRPKVVAPEVFAANWDAIFGRKVVGKSIPVDDINVPPLYEVTTGEQHGTASTQTDQG